MNRYNDPFLNPSRRRRQEYPMSARPVDSLGRRGAVSHDRPTLGGFGSSSHNSPHEGRRADVDYARRYSHLRDPLTSFSGGSFSSRRSESSSARLYDDSFRSPGEEPLRPFSTTRDPFAQPRRSTTLGSHREFGDVRGFHSSEFDRPRREMATYTSHPRLEDRRSSNVFSSSSSRRSGGGGGGSGGSRSIFDPIASSSSRRYDERPDRRDTLRWDGF